MRQHLYFFGALLSLAAMAGCGSGSGNSADFSLAASPAAVTVVPGGSAQSVAVTASALHGFTGSVAVAVGNLPAGVTAAPASFTLTPGSIQQIAITASSAATPGTATISLSGTAGSLTHEASSALTIGTPAPAVTTASLSTTFFDFGNNLVSNAKTQTVVAVTNTGSLDLTLSPSLTGDSSFTIAPATTCGQQLAAGASCDVSITYNPTTTSAPNQQSATLNLGFGDVPTGTPQTVAITGTSGALAQGTVTATNNPQVALYTMTLPFPGSVTVSFGPTTSYGLNTWSQSTDTAGGTVSIFVAGMKASTQYHMQAAVNFTNGLTATDVDHTFTTGAIAPNLINLSTTTTSGMTPQPGLEMLNPVISANGVRGVFITDLSGNMLWTYFDPGVTTGNQIDGAKMLPDGDLLLVIGINSSGVISGPVTAATINEIREINLAGDIVREITVNDLNAELASASCAECKVVLQTVHHDVEPLPNGHWLVLANTTKALSSTTTPPLTNAAAQTVIGDVIVDLDQNLQPVWVWNEFNHLDPNRHPEGLPDWTHTNAVLYSPDDGNILVSSRHQSWVMKVDYANGSGAGNILWRLGYQGDFTLVGGTAPTDWAYGQHEPNFASKNTSGVFSLVMMDNGDFRVFPAGVTCGSTGAPPCLYSTVPIFQIDESAKTATLTFHQVLPNLYNSFGGNAEILANGDVEYDLCGIQQLGTTSEIYEVTQEANPKTVWVMKTPQAAQYRAFRIPSMYPGVQW